MSTPLLPCPFCGGAPTVANLERKETRPDPLWRVSCNNVACPANPSMSERLGRDGTVAIWNTRAPSGAGMAVEPECVRIIRKYAEGAGSNSGVDAIQVPRSMAKSLNDHIRALRDGSGPVVITDTMVERAISAHYNDVPADTPRAGFSERTHAAHRKIFRRVIEAALGAAEVHL